MNSGGNWDLQIDDSVYMYATHEPCWWLKLNGAARIPTSKIDGSYVFTLASGHPRAANTLHRVSQY